LRLQSGRTGLLDHGSILFGTNQTREPRSRPVVSFTLPVPRNQGGFCFDCGLAQTVSQWPADAESAGLSPPAARWRTCFSCKQKKERSVSAPARRGLENISVTRACRRYTFVRCAVVVPFALNNGKGRCGCAQARQIRGAAEGSMSQRWSQNLGLKSD
jgi:hypothetical protein